ncbi:exo-rhamnogalacturonan lyase family protein [Streptomyces triticirhizae]|uniref:Tat pathway signal sequence domain protein n=1 Tax=Streptomyces triticirhizae TaxID=2483353 RepID=A0A3M2M5P1_9ACTN|nr:hypothetical protein [Streptomyces triticirhizae]RMI44143.1 hypothetical protein EBN88_05955 [Streptomyces triticirhizae]
MSANQHPGRRSFLAAATATAATGGAGLALGSPAAGAEPDGPDLVELHWLDGVPDTTTGTCWGVPWPRGRVAGDSDFALTDSRDRAVPVQSWPLAYWPDGSLKWSGHCLGADAGLADRLRIRPGRPAEPEQPVTVREDDGELVLGNGTVEVRVARGGRTLVRSLSRDGRTTATDGRLVLALQDGADGDNRVLRQTFWTGVASEVAVERTGPVRAVVRASGHYAVDGDDDGDDRTLFPWTVRLSLTAGAESIRLVHSFVWDGDPATDFVAGLGLRFTVPMVDEAHDRHVRFAGPDGGVWGEPVRVLTGLRRDAGEAVRRAQVAGTATPPLAEWDERVRDGYRELPLWNEFRLAQDSATHFSIAKRTREGVSWLRNAAHGDRAPGLGYVGGVSGGLGFGIRDFWQRYPRALDITGAATDEADVTLWSWSPAGEAMDMRPYADGGHGGGLAYEDNRDGWGDPRGISRSTDMEVWAFSATPSRSRVAELARALTGRPQVVASPETYHASGQFGRWSLPDRSTRARRAMEDDIAGTVAFYAHEVEQRSWYGFWDYGDVMHTYDSDRHVWRYDVGGFAWDNAELGTDAMLWYAFLRSGDPDAFRLAAAMTRHLSEADTCVAGRFAGRGVRHNVLHWGDGAKEARVSESYTRRFLYYLTADELLGDLMRASLQADATFDQRGELRIGPDWFALVSNWLTEWERTGDTRWRDRIVNGMRDIASFPAGLYTGERGGHVGWDSTADGHLPRLDQPDLDGDRNLAMAFLGEQIMFETIELVDVPEFRRALLDFARLAQAPAEERIERYGRDFDPNHFPTIYAKVTAWAGEQLDDPTLRARAWRAFLDDPAGRPWGAPVRVEGDAVLTPVDEIRTANGRTVATNDAAQRVLAAIALLAMAPDEAP